jgi:hypothetical protein
MEAPIALDFFVMDSPLCFLCFLLFKILLFRPSRLLFLCFSVSSCSKKLRERKTFARFGGRRKGARVSKRPFPIVKAIAIFGCVLAEIYMVFTMLAPNLPDQPTPWTHLVWRVFIGAIFFGPFGLAVGTGVGLLVQAVIPKRWVAVGEGKESQPASIEP